MVVTQVSPVSDTQPIAFTGDIQARVQTPLGFRVSGKISERLADVGNRVREGQVLARLDPQDLRNNLAAAQAQVDAQEARTRLARVDFERQAALLPKGYTSRSQYDQAQATLDGARSALQAAVAQRDDARKQLGYTELRASAAGVLTARHAEAGQVVQAGAAIFDLAVSGERDAVFELYESLSRELKLGQTLPVALQGQPTVTTQGTLREIAPTVAATGTVRIKVQLDQPPPAMTLGAVVNAQVPSTAAQGFALPWTALNGTTDQPAVWRLDDAGRVSLQPLHIERYTRDSIIVSDGLKAGERIVIAGGQSLSPGQRVEVAERSTFAEVRP
ncbi:RND transporter [Pseudomonas oryzihabitans]|nr:RND transporter [Pseudomonas psychrotolerans]KTT26387.1 RND transporter [Pseudomonas psychrotolerans]